jgi:hypothetical protein
VFPEQLSFKSLVSPPDANDLIIGRILEILNAGSILASACTARAYNFVYEAQLYDHGTGESQGVQVWEAVPKLGVQ